MAVQFKFFEDPAGESVANRLEGYRYQPELITQTQEQTLLTHIRELPFREFEFHGFSGKRRVVSFGWQYDFSGRELRKADDIPDFLLPVRALAASFANVEPEWFQHALVIEYGPGVGIGWHRDKAVFGEVVGISLLSACVLRFRRKQDQRWERVNVLTEPRSAYHLTGPARSIWEHSILRVDALRYSITFRNVLDEQVKAK
jgi:alkylated DNA repair dioxygenase AlkB